MRNTNLQPSRYAAGIRDLSLAAVTFLLLSASSLSLAAQTDYTRWVNPFIGTGGHGHTFPGATTPFGMVQLSPDTRTDNWDGSSGYHYSDDLIYGFSHTHLSGTGIPDYCDILLMPTLENFQFSAGVKDGKPFGYATKFSHANEHAEPGYYSVKLDNGISAEMTATTRVGIHRYMFPSATDQFITLDLRWRDKLLGSDIVLVNDNGRNTHRIDGFRRSSSWAKDQIIYFSMEFSKPVRVSTEARSPDTIDIPGMRRVRVLRFDGGSPLIVKVALSPVSIEGARKNLAAEMPGWDFDKVRAEAKAAWNKELSKIEVSGGTDAQTTTFYTALYHTMIQPNIFEDVDGSYRGHDGKIHNINSDGVSGALQKPDREGGRNTARGSLDTRSPYALANARASARSHEYTVFSLWDTFRAAHPLYTIIDQRRTVDFINTFIRQYEQGGRLPVWELAGNETDCMIGYHAVSVIADAMAKGIKGFDYEKAYEAAKHSAELDREGLAGYKKRGYISMEDSNESVSKTLEYAYDDWCITQMAIYLGLDRYKRGAEAEQAIADEYRTFLDRARYFENLFDPSTAFMRPKKNGGFVEPFAPNEVTFGFTEGNSWQYSFFAPQDVTHLMQLMGGREKFTAKLDELFTTTQKLGGREQADLTGLIGQYAHGNEPSHHIAYLYDYAGHPEKTQMYVRKVMDEFYKPEPDGVIGNEDCGQMSAWYIMSAAGIYEVTPGSGVYAFGTPLFPELKFHLENGKTFTVRAPNVSNKDFFIAGAKLNGKAYKKAFIKHEDIIRGGALEFTMDDTPSRAAFDMYPTSSIAGGSVAVPVITAKRTFVDKTPVALSTLTPNAKIYYTADGTTPTISSGLYTSPFTIDRNSIIKAIAVGAAGQASLASEARLNRQPNDWTVKVVSGYSRQYTGGGDNAIVDGIRGTTNFASGEWQGIQGKPYEAIIDLQRATPIKEVGASFLQDAGPWIWIPDRIEFEVSSDGQSFVKVAEIKPNFPQREMTPTIREYIQAIQPTTARYVRLRAFNFGKIPSWHPGADGDPWIFIDEVLIK